ncbi:hypothetical protein [Mycolicibacterium komossense]|uniref:SMI1/KNR4 family protein n=1 Tax=Mycolicibacterium komossense TaxID=1779 RepID=A0ABT3CEX1_9MYCO|nr:hypothetical protein [Mycolicibacterium komossense]MCV7227928.1 hypothetical protein [Mycolicibacterium komossense]
MDDEGARLGAQAARHLRDYTRQIETGLTEAEFARVEGRFGFQFADDHRAFLAAGLPVGERWPDWRDGADEDLLDRLGWPVEGVLFDVENNALWMDEWGERPVEMADALTLASHKLAGVPQMVPVYGHRYLPAGRGTYGHPVLSIYQADIICYGFTLVDYLDNEFGPGPDNLRWASAVGPQPTVEFWSELVS